MARLDAADMQLYAWCTGGAIKIDVWNRTLTLPISPGTRREQWRADGLESHLDEAPALAAKSVLGKKAGLERG
jgi:hypothetical protein